MEVGLDPELTKWSVHSGPAIVLTGKGYKEHHWLAVPPSTSSVISTSTQPPLILPCRCLLALSPGPKTSTEGVMPPFGFVVKQGTVPTPGGPLLPLCLTRRDTA